MTVISPSGTSRFSLNGTFRATVTVAKCWKSNYTAPSSGGAFASANNSGRGAFGGGAFGGIAPRKTPANQRTRANTLELATQYLAKSKQPYAILPANKNTLKHFPVNWKYSRGGIGGMRVFKNTSVSVEKLLSVLLADQAKLCKGRNASQRNGLRTVQGRQMIRAKGVCETSKGAVLDITYKVAELGQRMVISRSCWRQFLVRRHRPHPHAGPAGTLNQIRVVPPGVTPDGAHRRSGTQAKTRQRNAGAGFTRHAHRRLRLFVTTIADRLRTPRPIGSIGQRASGRSLC